MAEKELETDMKALIALFDWLGLSNPVLYGYDWGAIRACKFKMLHPKRVKYVVLENRAANMDPQQCKEAMRRGDMTIYGGVFTWFFDGWPSSKDPPLGTNMKGWKYKADFLWPCHNGSGKPDPKHTGSVAKFGAMYVKAAKGKLVDCWGMSEDDIAGQIASHCK